MNWPFADRARDRLRWPRTRRGASPSMDERTLSTGVVVPECSAPSSRMVADEPVDDERWAPPLGRPSITLPPRTPTRPPE